MLDALAATAVAQAATIAAGAGSSQTATAQTALAANGVITVTVTLTPEPAAALAQRPIDPPAQPPPLDSRTFFVRVLDSAGSTVALLWFLGGSVLFFVTAGVLAGLSFRAKEQARYTLEHGDGGVYVAQPPGNQALPGQPPAAPPAASAGKTQADDNWPASLP